MDLSYPALIINRAAVRTNTGKVCSWCEKAGVFVTGVIKGSNGSIEVAEDMVTGGAKIIASSRMEQLERCKDSGIEVPLMLIRVPMISEVPRMIDTCEYSLNSELATLEIINKSILKKSAAKHKVILMADLGDLREGFFDNEDLIDTACKVENELDGLELAGIGTNLGCYGSIVPTDDKLHELVSLADRIEKAIGRKLDIVSGGATSSLLGVFDGYMQGINMLRIGAAILAGPYEELKICYGRHEMDELECPFVLEAEIVEIKDKPTYPIGKIGVDAYGNKEAYVDRGVRRRALLAVGRADYGDQNHLIPMDSGIEVVGSSGDHTIIDIEDCDADYRVGDILRFNLRYSAILNLSASENINKVYK